MAKSRKSLWTEAVCMNERTIGRLFRVLFVPGLYQNTSPLLLALLLTDRTSLCLPYICTTTTVR